LLHLAVKWFCTSLKLSSALFAYPPLPLRRSAPLCTARLTLVRGVAAGRWTLAASAVVSWWFGTNADTPYWLQSDVGPTSCFGLPVWPLPWPPLLWLASLAMRSRWHIYEGSGAYKRRHSIASSGTGWIVQHRWDSHGIVLLLGCSECGLFTPPWRPPFLGMSIFLVQQYTCQSSVIPLGETIYLSIKVC
jgi:hypothetical protein